jgi:hypothetical protein
MMTKYIKENETLGSLYAVFLMRFTLSRLGAFEFRRISNEHCLTEAIAEEEALAQPVEGDMVKACAIEATCIPDPLWQKLCALSSDREFKVPTEDQADLIAEYC